MVSFDVEADAEEFARAARTTAPKGFVSTSDAIAQYRVALEERGARPISVRNVLDRLERWEVPADLREFTEAQVRGQYRKMATRLAAASHHDYLKELQRWLAWCAEQGLIKASPAAAVKPTGKRRRGKAQLRLGEAQRFAETAVREARAGDAGATALLAVLYLGLRSREIRERVVRDLDVTPHGAWLWLDEGKTERARRRLEVPAELVQLLEERARGKLPTAPLFESSKAKAGGGVHHRGWLLHACHRLCDLAGVPRVAPHGLRGTHASLAEEAGATAHFVAAALGHASHRVTSAHYLAAGTEARAAGRRVLTLVPLSAGAGTSGGN